MLQVSNQTNNCLAYNRYNNVNVIDPQDGEIWLANLTDAEGSQQGGIRPVLIVSNNKYNHFAPTVNARELIESENFVGIPLTSRVNKYSPVHVNYSVNEIVGLIKDSVVEVEQIRTINKVQLIEKMGKMTVEQQELVAEKSFIQMPMLQRYLEKQLKLAIAA